MCVKYIYKDAYWNTVSDITKTQECLNKWWDFHTWNPMKSLKRTGNLTNSLTRTQLQNLLLRQKWKQNNRNNVIPFSTGLKFLYVVHEKTLGGRIGLKGYTPFLTLLTLRERQVKKGISWLVLWILKYFFIYSEDYFCVICVLKIYKYSRMSKTLPG